MRKMKDSGIEWIGEIPEDWEIERLKNVLWERKENNSPVKTTEILSLLKDRGVILYSEKGDIGNKSKKDISNYKLAYPGDIVLNSMNIIIGSVGLSNYFGAVSPVYYMLNKRKLTDNIRYFNYVFQIETFQKMLIGYGNGILAHRMRIPMDKLNNVLLPIPNSKLQTKIADFLDKKTAIIDSIIADTKQSIEELISYKQSIITEAITHGMDKVVPMKDSEVGWIGSVPKGWKVSKIKRLFSITKTIANSNDYQVLSITQQGLKIKDIESNEGQMASDYSKYQIVKPGYFAMNHMDLLTGGVDYSKYKGVTSPDYRVFKIAKPEYVNPYYYLYVFKILYWNKIFYGEGQGVSNLGRWRLQADKFNNFYIPTPPITEQKKIVDYLDNKVISIDKLIIEKEKMISEYEAYKKSLIYEYVTGKKQVI